MFHRVVVISVFLVRSWHQKKPINLSPDAPCMEFLPRLAETLATVKGKCRQILYLGENWRDIQSPRNSWIQFFPATAESRAGQSHPVHSQMHIGISKPGEVLGSSCWSIPAPKNAGEQRVGSNTFVSSARWNTWAAMKTMLFFFFKEAKCGLRFGFMLLFNTYVTCFILYLYYIYMNIIVYYVIFYYVVLYDISLD